MSKKALFWDFDGTLIYPNESFLCALQNALISFEYTVDPDIIRDLLHRVCSWRKPEISYTNATGEKWWDALFDEFEIFYESIAVFPKDRMLINETFKEYILDHNNYTLFHDVKECLSKCQNIGFDNYILSNNFPELTVLVDKFELSHLFVDYIVSANIGYEKPRIELFEYARKIAGDPDTCFMIGDNPIADMQGGKKAGMYTILVHNTTMPKTGYTDFICENLIDILDIVKKA